MTAPIRIGRIGRLLILALVWGMLPGCVFDLLGQRRRQETAELQAEYETLNARTQRLESGAPPLEEPLPDAAAQAPAVPTVPSVRFPRLPIDWRRALGKLVRGVVNTVTGWVEIPKRVDQTSLTSGPGAGFTFGLLRGFGHGLVRTAAGVYEIVTFPVPAPPNYEPVIQPEYVFRAAGPDPYPSS